jgi:branched-chain amino acid aminotransferase
MTKTSIPSNATTRLVYFNGEMIPEAEARLSIYDSALMFGDVAFEMTRSFNKRQFKLREHLERLQASARWLHIAFDYTIEQLEDICCQVVEANEPFFAPDDEHRLMIDVTRGLLGIYANRVTGISSGTNLLVADFPLRWTVVGSANLYREGIDIVIPSQRMIPASLLEPKAKNRNRIHYLLANVEVSQNIGRNVWALLLDPDGFLTEGTGSNFLLVKDGCLLSPEPRNILRGISRNYIIELAGELGIPFKETNMEPFDIMTADEAFFCCTPFCMVPAFRFHGRPIGTGGQGPVYTKLVKRWGEKVGVDIVGQIEKWALSEKDDNTRGATPYKFNPTPAS